MRLSRKSLSEIIDSGGSVIGFWGAPPRDALEGAAASHPGLPFFDLDVHYGAKATRRLPDAFCHIIRNCVDNALALGPALRAVVAATGQEKCDSGRYAAGLVAELTDAAVIETVNEAPGPLAPPALCEARGSLRARTDRIMRSIIEPLAADEQQRAVADRCAATHGFWGTPPHPIELLDLFPETTHIFGWTRCVEQGRPADRELELAVPAGLPVVFFSQGFCAKGMLARRLAERHRGMHVDVHDTLNAATRAKIEAFIRLAVPPDDRGAAR